MAIFKKESPAEKVIKMYGALSDEEKKSVHSTIMDLEKAEDEREVDKIEEEKAETSEKKDEKKEEVKEESEVIGKDVDKAEEEESNADDNEEESENNEENGEQNNNSEESGDSFEEFKTDVMEMFKALNAKIDGLVIKKDGEKKQFGKGGGCGEYERQSNEPKKTSKQLFEELGMKI